MNKLDALHNAISDAVTLLYTGGRAKAEALIMQAACDERKIVFAKIQKRKRWRKGWKG